LARYPSLILNSSRACEYRSKYRRMIHRNEADYGRHVNAIVLA